MGRLSDLFDEMSGPDWQAHPPSVDALLELQRALYARTLADDVKAGRTGEDLARPVHPRLSRSNEASDQNEAANFLLRGMSQALSRVFTGQLADGSSPRGELARSSKWST